MIQTLPSISSVIRLNLKGFLGYEHRKAFFKSLTVNSKREKEKPLSFKTTPPLYAQKG